MRTHMRTELHMRTHMRACRRRRRRRRPSVLRDCRGETTAPTRALRRNRDPVPRFASCPTPVCTHALCMCVHQSVCFNVLKRHLVSVTAMRWLCGRRALMPDCVTQGGHSAEWRRAEARPEQNPDVFISSTRILGRRMAPFPTFLIPNRVPHDLTQDPSTQVLVYAARTLNAAGESTPTLLSRC